MILSTNLPITLHWSPRSPFVRKVMIVAHELQIVDQLELVRSPVAMTIPNSTLMQENPLSKLPTLVLSDGTVLYDSRVICEYLIEQGQSSTLLPQGEHKWQVLQQQALGDGLLDFLLLYRQELMKSSSQQSQLLLDAFALKTAATLDRLEQSSHFLTNSAFSLGHIAIGCALSYLDYRFSDELWRQQRPALTRWHESFEQRASVKSTQPTDVP